jgi:hypothetical protein
MKIKILLPLVVLSLSTFASESPMEDFAYYPRQSSSESAEAQAQAIDQAQEQFFQNMETMENARKITYVKSPCANMRGYHFRRYRGFSFENGVVKKFGFSAPMLTADPMRFASMADFFRRRHVCQPAVKNVRPLGFNIYQLDIWR